MVPEPPPSEDDVAEEDAAPSPEVDPVAGAEAPAEDVPPLPPRKSVTYQPDPLSWKPAAVTCLVKVDWWHCGHSVSTGSEIFCSTSCAWPQAPQRYA